MVLEWWDERQENPALTSAKWVADPKRLERAVGSRGREQSSTAGQRVRTTLEVLHRRLTTDIVTCRSKLERHSVEAGEVRSIAVSELALRDVREYARYLLIDNTLIGHPPFSLR